ncbi:MAG: TonB-dependent receptor [Bacteroidota bacterium]
MLNRVGVLIILGLLSGIPDAVAQERATLSGFVRDATSGETLIGVNIYAPLQQRGTVTNEYGFYSLTLPADTAIVRFSYLGYQAQVVALHLAADQAFDVGLEPATVGLDGVEVVAERDEGEVRSTQMSATTLPIEAVEKLPAFLGEVDVIKALQLLPGVQSGAEGSTGMYVRGGGPDQNLILLDGAPIYNASHVFGLLSVFNAAALQHVRLVKGGFPAQYGGRLSSVVDISMKEGNLKRYQADGSVGLVFSSLTLQGPLVKEKASFIVSARRTYIDVLARPFLKRRLPDGQRLVSYFYDANAKLNYAPSRRDRLFLSIYLGQDAYGSTFETVETDADSAYRERNTNDAGWGNRTATLRWNHLFSNTLFANTTLFASRYGFDIGARLEQTTDGTTPTTQTEAVAYRSGIADLGARIDFDYRPSPAHAIRFGASVTRHRFNPGVSRLRLSAVGDTTLAPNTRRIDGTEGYLYVEDDMEVSRRLSVNAGLHASALWVEGTAYASLQPRLSARWLLRDDWSLKASFSTMRQYLHLLTNAGLNLPTDLWLPATRRIGPQRAWQAAVGTAYESAWLGGLNVSVEGYYKDMRGLIEYAPGESFISPLDDWQDRVVRGRGWSYGGEVLLRKTSGRTTGWIGYTLSWSQRRFPTLNGGAIFPYRYDRRHDLSVVVNHQLTNRLDVGATWVYGTGQAITLAEARYADARLQGLRLLDETPDATDLTLYGGRGSYRMADYHRLDVALNIQFDKALFARRGTSTLSLGAYNAYNRKNPFYLFTERTGNGGTRYKQASLFPVLPFFAYRFQF